LADLSIESSVLCALGYS